MRKVARRANISSCHFCDFILHPQLFTQGCCKVSLRPAGAGAKETGGRPQAPAKGRCPFEPRLFPISPQPWLFTWALCRRILYLGANPDGLDVDKFPDTEGGEFA